MLRNRFYFCFFAVIFFIILLSSISLAGNFIYRNINGVKLNINLDSPGELQYKGIVREDEDISCSAAALATVFNFYYDDFVKKEQLVGIMNNVKVPDGSGMSLLMLKLAAEQGGYKVYALKADLDGLGQINLPSILLLEAPGFPHFTVVKGVREGLVYLADPAWGNIQIQVEKFREMWNGIVIAIEGDGRDINKYYFNIGSDSEISPVKNIQEFIKINSVSIIEFNNIDF